MRLQVHHRTEYLYQDIVSRNSNEVRLQPLDTRWQICEASFISVLPAVRMKQYEDLNMNRVHHFQIEDPHDRLVIDSRTTVVTKKRLDPDKMPYGYDFMDQKACRLLEECHPFLQSSHYAEISPQAWKQGLDIKGEQTDVLSICISIMEFIYGNFRYEKGATTSSTHATEVLSLKSGVCQDFSHAMVAICRSLGIPARYVSGYFYDPGRDDALRGSGASHAWVEIYVHSFGWVPLDPTNNKLVDDTYIVLAVGRDYKDVAPVKGTYFGASSSWLNVRVSVNLAN